MRRGIKDSWALSVGQKNLIRRGETRESERGRERQTKTQAEETKEQKEFQLLLGDERGHQSTWGNNVKIKSHRLWQVVSNSPFVTSAAPATLT